MSINVVYKSGPVKLDQSDEVVLFCLKIIYIRRNFRKSLIGEKNYICRIMKQVVNKKAFN